MSLRDSVCLSVIVVTFGCTTSLQPAAHALQPPDQNSAVMSEERGVRVVAEARSFPGHAYIEAEVTPVRVTIANGSEKPLFVRYHSFRLKASDGSQYSAIPPHQVSGTVPSAEALPPSIGVSRFEVAPYYQGFYPGIAAYRGPFDYDAVYYDNHYGYWRTTTQLPTVEMLRRALPEGILNDGGNLEGYLYFPALELERGTEVVLHVQLDCADGDYASFRLPFVVK